MSAASYGARPRAAGESGCAAAFPAGSLTVGMLEQRLLDRFPASDAEDWDRTGMLVGDAACPVTGVCVALDPTVDALRQTQQAGANVLVTHHPLFLDPPTAIMPPDQRGDAVGARVWEAIRLGVSVLSFHTALDVSPLAAQVLPGMLCLRLQGILEVVRHDPDRGYGQICTPGDGGISDAPFTLNELACRCQTAFHSVPRVWGAPDTELQRIVTCTGAAGDDLALACDAGIDCVVAGEVRYHKALDAASRGLCVVELGHDISEYPLCSVLVSSVAKCGIDANSVRVLDRAGNWRSGAADGLRRI